jgi:iron complex transport system substrate-binding protein
VAARSSVLIVALLAWLAPQIAGRASFADDGPQRHGGTEDQVSRADLKVGPYGIAGRGNGIAGRGPYVSAVGSPQSATPPAIPRRIVSLVPSLTEELFAIGAGPQVIAVSNFDSYPEAATRLPRVGGLLDPDMERILAMRPDLVVLYGSQVDAEAQLKRSGIRTFSYRHGGIPAVFASTRALAAVTGHAPEGERVVRDLQTRLDAIRSKVKGLRRPRTLVVIDRQPGTLRSVYASGGIGFVHDMLEIAGGDNVFAEIKRESVQPSTETLLTKSPDVVLEVRAAGVIAPSAMAAERAVWSALRSVPAVRDNRIHILVGGALVVPGPRVADGTETLARTLHPDAFK